MKTTKLSILATIAVLFTPLAALAGDAQTSIQNNRNAAVTTGDANLILQQAHQNSHQTQVGVGKSGYPYGYGSYKTPSAQTSAQINANEAAAIGKYNVVGQTANQNNRQTSVDVNKYIPSYLGH